VTSSSGQAVNEDFDGLALKMEAVYFSLSTRRQCLTRLECSREMEVLRAAAGFRLLEKIRYDDVIQASFQCK